MTKLFWVFHRLNQVLACSIWDGSFAGIADIIVVTEGDSAPCGLKRQAMSAEKCAMGSGLFFEGKKGIQCLCKSVKGFYFLLFRLSISSGFARIRYSHIMLTANTQ